MKTLIELEKKINSELTTKINSSEIKHDQLYITIDKEDLIVEGEYQEVVDETA